MTQKYGALGGFAEKYAAQGRAEDRVEGAAAARKGLFTILKLRGLTLTEEERARIEAAPLPVLERWIEGAAIPQKYKYQSDFAKKYFGQGWAEGRAEGAAAARKGLHRILRLRGVTLTDEQRACIEAAQPAELERWIEGAATTESAEALLGRAEQARAPRSVTALQGRAPRARRTRA